MHNIPILHDIFLSFHSHFSGFFYLGFAAIANEIFIGNHLGPDEAFLKVGVDNSRSLRGGGTYRNGPGSYFLYPGGKICL